MAEQNEEQSGDGGTTRVWLLRHAETANPAVFHAAESDVGLSARGQRSCGRLGLGGGRRGCSPAARFVALGAAVDGFAPFWTRYEREGQLFLVRHCMLTLFWNACCGTTL